MGSGKGPPPPLPRITSTHHLRDSLTPFIRESAVRVHCWRVLCTCTRCISRSSHSYQFLMRLKTEFKHPLGTHVFPLLPLCRLSIIVTHACWETSWDTLSDSPSLFPQPRSFGSVPPLDGGGGDPCLMVITSLVAREFLGVVPPPHPIFLLGAPRTPTTSRTHRHTTNRPISPKRWSQLAGANKLITLRAWLLFSY